MLIQAVLVRIWIEIAGVDKLVLWVHIHRLIVTELIVGLISGDVNTGLITGIVLELAWVGAITVGDAQPPNTVTGGVTGVALVIIIGSDPQMTVGLAVPFAVAARTLITLLYTAMSPIMYKFGVYTKGTDTEGVGRVPSSLPVILSICYLFVVFLCIFFGTGKASSLISILFEWNTHDLNVTGGMIPAVGSAMSLKAMWEASYVPFFIFGFIMAACLGLGILAVAGLTVAITLYEFYTQRNDAATVSDNDGGFKGDDT